MGNPFPPRMQVAVVKPPRREPSNREVFSEEIANMICERTIEGISLTRICSEDPAMPSKPTVYKWLAQKPEFRAQYIEAKQLQAHTFAEKIHETGDLVTESNARSYTVKLNAYKWMAEKLAPKVYGQFERHEVTGKDGGPLAMTAVNPNELSDAELAAIATSGRTTPSQS